MSSRRTSFLGCGCVQCVNMTICISATDLAHSRPLNPLREERVSPLAAATQSPKAYSFAALRLSAEIPVPAAVSAQLLSYLTIQNMQV